MITPRQTSTSFFVPRLCAVQVATPRRAAARGITPKPPAMSSLDTMTLGGVSMRLAIKSCIVTLLLFAPKLMFAQPATAASASMTSATALYDRAARAYSTQQTIDAQFDQKISNPLLGKTAVSHGRFVQQKPHRVSIDFTDPAGDRIVDDGKSLWVYLPSSSPGEVIKLPSNSDGAIIVDMLGQFLDAPRQSFTITGGDAASVDGVATRKVLLVPRVANSVPFTKATLWIDDSNARLRQIEVIDGQGVDRTITMKSWAANTTIDKNVFKFAVPKGVKVVTKLP